MTAARQTAIRIPSKVWRAAASQHQEKIVSILKPGLTPLDHPLNVGMRRQYKKENNKEWVTALDPKNPVYNFLIEYYGLKGAKGVRKLCRWSPSPGLLMHCQSNHIETVDQLHTLSAAYTQETITDVSTMCDSVLLEGADENDFGSTIHLRGATVVDGEGVMYSPATFYGKGDPSQREDSIRLSSPFLWYQSILQQTLTADPILHCYGLHEWAMQYQPEGAPIPPSGQYQAHLPLRVSREVINETVERKGVSCTHVDALRFFAQDALPLNKFGGSLKRDDQVKLEQPACVHAHMDLLKVALKLTPFGDAQLLQSVLEMALEARKLDVAASPYDASAYGVGVIPIDTPEGRGQYREDQMKLMKRVEPVRKSLLRAYSNLLQIAFDDSILELGKTRLPSKSQQEQVT
ncbi:unnamed protein product [Cylindrotheca closterium]|uniref:Uncharacterized protein n=1 Tax=Cylindrotheca closterium TaxID=2856 RepID=A0AAD2FGB9_9STRA|nr:unnamed protein product [Cylindrotheca closterium]